MFVQVIQGQVSDRDGIERLFERWQTELRPDAIGFLGATTGITDDGRLLNVARFDTAESARANSDRPEQGAWWNELEKCFAAAPTFIESTDVELTLGGGSDDAGFVQAMIGRATDRAKVSAGDREFERLMTGIRPDYLGGVRIWHGDDEFVELAYFRTEAEAREGEAKQLPAEVKQAVDDWMGAIEGLTYLDLRTVRTA